jgi:hypothetical protein
MRSHYGYDSFFCAPGVNGAHEEGGVEGEIGRFRRRYLTPMPQVGSLEALNAALAAADARDDARRIGGRAETVGEAASREKSLLRPLPAKRFDVALRLSCRVDAKARICVRQSYYSVPARYAGRRLEVRLGATMITVYDGAMIIAEHPRSLHKYSEDLILDHYLEVLCRKPGALAGSTALAAARTAGKFTDDHQRFWETARRRARHPRPDRGVAAAPHPGRRHCDRRHERRAEPGQLRPRPGRSRSQTCQPPRVAAAQGHGA